MSERDVRCWVGFNKVPGIGTARLRSLLDHFGDLEVAWRAPTHDLQQAGLDRRSLASLLRVREALDLDAEMERLQQAGVHVVTQLDERYPPNLLQA